MDSGTISDTLKGFYAHLKFDFYNFIYDYEFCPQDKQYKY